MGSAGVAVSFHLASGSKTEDGMILYARVYTLFEIEHKSPSRSVLSLSALAPQGIVFKRVETVSQCTTPNEHLPTSARA